ncbi:MAG: tRNA pseudouridine(38-40) synthase TruA [Sinobacterium sp.]|nr:tRNA pseudouridine(38-40) synthase TruA [Sinobacterium sp.]
MAKPFSTDPIRSNKIAMQIEYNGRHYHGWQIQKKPIVATVQALVEKAITQVANHKVGVLCSGRTDARVHGTAQVIHFETSSIRSQKAWVCGVNANLPDDIVVRWAGAVDDDFHARFSATARTYRYIIANTDVRSANFAGAVTCFEPSLDEQLMHEAAQHLIGEHDFSSFRGAACQSNTPFRCIEYVDVKRAGELVVIEIKANAFLLHMVRNVVGCLLEVGEGRKPSNWLKEVLGAKDRGRAGVTAKPEGLYFVRAHYPESCGIALLPLGPALLGVSL